MKRLRVILLFLLLGAIINAAVAWSCAAWVITPPTGMQTAWVYLPALKRVKGWDFSRKEAFGATQLVAMARDSRRGKYDEFDEVLPAWSDLKTQMDEAAQTAQREAIKPENVNIIGTVSPTVLMQKAYGFPFRSMYWNWDSGIITANPVWRNPISTGITLKVNPSRPGTISLDNQRALPLGVLPFGFILNSLFYAVILWMLWFVLFGWYYYRSNRRRNLGRCPKCAYDLRGCDHEACPECGQECPSS